MFTWPSKRRRISLPLYNLWAYATTHEIPNTGIYRVRTSMYKVTQMPWAEEFIAVGASAHGTCYGFTKMAISGRATF